ncbi:MAG: glycosyltransferase family 39 protein [Magnetococcus sp. THC-1_WYH]
MFIDPQQIAETVVMASPFPFTLYTFKSRSPVWGVLIAILALGGWMRLTDIAQTHVPRPFGPDAWHYFNYAYNILHHGVYSKDPSILSGIAPVADGLRTPGYPLFLIPFIALLPGDTFIAPVLKVQAWMSLLTLVLTYVLARSVLPVALALLATFLTALCPHLISMNHYLLTESLFTFLLVASLVLLTRKGGWPLWFAIGIVVCLAGMVRPIWFYFLPIAIWLIGTRQAVPNRKKRSLAFVLGFFLIMTPWMVRNKISLGTLSDSSSMNSSMAQGIYPQITYDSNPKTFGYPYRFDPRFQEISASKGTILKEFLTRLTHEPWRYLHWYILEKPVWLWSWSIIQGQGDIFIYPVTHSPYFEQPWFQFSHHIMAATHWIFVFLGGIGCILPWLPRKFQPTTREPSLFTARLLSLTLGFMTGIHMIVPPYPRYSIPLRPLLYCMALYCLWGIFTNLARWSVSRFGKQGVTDEPQEASRSPQEYPHIGP